MFPDTKNMKGKVEKMFMFRGKVVHIVSLYDENKKIYCFKIYDKGEKKSYYSVAYDNQQSCEKDSMKVVKGI